MALLQKLFVWLGATSVSNNCDIFLAPSKLNGGGWGVYAARDFEESEVVELAPLYLPIDHMAPVVKNSVLDDYHYGMWRGGKTVGVVALGMVMFYNHDQEPNVQWTTNLGRGEPSAIDPTSATAVGFVATREISQGEELFSSYGVGDDGVRWFAERRIDLVTASEESMVAPELLDAYRNEYCSKMYAGIGLATFKDRLKPENEFYLFQTGKLPTVDAPTAVANVAIKAGERIEIAPALVLSKEVVEGTAIAPLVFTWDDWTEEHQKALKELREAGQLKLQYQSPDTQWLRVDRFDSFERVVVFPAAGSIGMVKRVGATQPNCGVKIKSSGSGAGSAGLVLEVFALKDIEQWETLRLNIRPTGTASEKLALVEILATTGQLIPDSLQASKQNKAGNEL